MTGELELYSTEALIDEIVHRSSFRGLIVRAKEECRGPRKENEVYRVIWNGNLTDQDVTDVLNQIQEYLLNKDQGNT